MAEIDAPEQDMLAGSAARFLATAQALTDDDLHQASALPGWTRAHVLTHLAQGADSRTGLLRAARAGRVGRQYPSEQARAEAIDAGARRSPTVIRADLQRAVHDCLTAIRQHPRHRWDAPAITLAAGPQPVRDVVPSLRRELEYHHVDLAAGYQPADWPDDFAATELSLVTAWMNRRADAPPMTLTGPCALRIDTSPPVDIAGPPPALLAWLTGRSNGSALHPDPAALPTLPPLGLARPRARVPGTMASVARGGEKRSALQRRRPFLTSRRSPLLALGDHYATFRDDHEWRGMRRAACGAARPAAAGSGLMTQPFKPTARPRARKRGGARKVAPLVALGAVLLGIIAFLLFVMPVMAIHFNGAAGSLQGQLSRGIVLCNGQPLRSGNTCEVVSGTSDYDTTSASVLNQMAEGTISSDHDDAWICLGFAAVSWVLAITISALVSVGTLRKAKARRVLAAGPAD